MCLTEVMDICLIYSGKDWKISPVLGGWGVGWGGHKAHGTLGAIFQISLMTLTRRN